MRTLVTLLSVGIGMMAIGSGVAGFDVEEKEEFSTTKSGGARGVLDIENTNGGITVVGVSEGNEVRITGEKIARGRDASDARDALGAISVDIVQTGEGVTVKTSHPDGGDRRNYSVNYRIEVPRGWDVKVRNANGAVSVAGVQKSVSASVANGAVKIDEVVGDLQLDVANGGIRSNAQIPANGVCKIKTVNGAINAKLTVDPSASCAIKSSNGAISLSLPNNTSAGVSATTTTGRISVQGLQFANKTSDRNIAGGETFSGTLGSGTGKVQLEVVHGAIALKGF